MWSIQKSQGHVESIHGVLRACGASRSLKGMRSIQKSQGHVEHPEVSRACGEHPWGVKGMWSIQKSQGHVEHPEVSRACGASMMCQGHVGDSWGVKGMCSSLEVSKGMRCQGHVEQTYDIKGMRRGYQRYDEQENEMLGFGLLFSNIFILFFKTDLGHRVYTHRWGNIENNTNLQKHIFILYIHGHIGHDTAYK